MLKQSAIAFIACIAIPAWAGNGADDTSNDSSVSVDALAHAGATCSVGKRQERKMLQHIEDTGFQPYIGAELETRERTTGRRDPAGINLFTRENVKLTYFHSKMMRSCKAEGVVGENFSVDALLSELTDRLGKQPKVDTPNQKYLFKVSGVILTVQIKQAEGETTVSLGTVRT